MEENIYIYYEITKDGSGYRADCKFFGDYNGDLLPSCEADTIEEVVDLCKENSYNDLGRFVDIKISID